MRRPFAALALALAAGCGGATPPPESPLDAARRTGEASADGEVVGEWLLAELLSPGGEAATARKARERLDRVPHAGLHAALARAIDDGGRGKSASAAEAYLDVVKAARSSQAPEAPMVAWFATHHLLSLRASTKGLWAKAAPVVEDVIARPGAIGWRARSELVDWWSGEAWDAAKAGVQDLAADRYGCLREVRLAGPFGHQAPGDRRRAFDPERPGAWQRVWSRDPLRKAAPTVLKTERHGCQVEAAEPAPGGVYYAETFVDLAAPREVIVAVQGAYAVRVDDVLVLERDTREWGVWQRFGARLSLAAGRHRIVARLGEAETSVRVLAVDGTPLGAPSTTDARAPYVVTPPVVLADPNALARFVAQGRPTSTTDGVVDRYVGAYLAHVESQDDLASVIMEPLVRELSKATGPALAMAAVFAEKDPIFPDSDAHDLVKELRSKAAAADEGLWWPRYWLAVDDADKRGLSDAATELRKLWGLFPEVPQVGQGLAGVYGRLGWRAERTRVIRDLAARFPDDRGVLEQVLPILEDAGQRAEADEVRARIRKLDPDSELALDQALARRDYAAAIAELERLGKRRPDRKDIAGRIAEVMVRAGNDKEAWAKLERALAKNPADAQARLKLADARYAAGDHQALRKALADAIQRGADTSDLAGAIELVEGANELTPYRLDGRKVVADYDAAKVEMAGTAARILDYAVTWAHPDGSSRMLEHELIRVQSQEAIGQMAEQRVPNGLLLRMRVLKKGGAVLEPEFVSGKPTLTMPHLEVGDTIETETITSQAGDGEGGRQYVGPHWFFREADVAYFRSELVAITPKGRPTVIETHGAVPKPVVEERDGVEVRRWRVDMSPAAPQEPASAPVQEFLPSVRLAWGLSLDERMRRMAEAMTDELPRDPRLVRIATTIVTGMPSSSPDAAAAVAALSKDERARRLYRWILSNVEDGREGDGRRVVVGKAGSRLAGFLYLCRALDVPVEVAVVRDRLTAPDAGPITEVGTFDDFLVRAGDGREGEPRWLAVGDKYAPFGYVPATLRGQPAYRLVEGTPKATVSAGGTFDGVVYEGTGELRADGSAAIDLEERFVGKLAISLRAGLESLPEAQLQPIVESKLIGPSVPGARVVKVTVEHKDELDAPVVLRMKLEVPELARRQGGALVIAPPFAIRPSHLTTLPTRQTPMLLGEPMYAEVKLALKLPAGARVVKAAPPTELKDGDRVVVVHDVEQAGTLVLERRVDIPAGRVQPDAYAAFQAFTRAADDALLRELVIEIPAN